MSTDIAAVVLTEVHRILHPLYRVAYSPDVLRDARRFFLDCGWAVTADVDPADLTDTIDTVIGAVETMMADPVPDDLVEAVQRLDLLARVVAEVRDLGNQLASLDGGAPPSTSATAALAEDLAHHLALRWLRTKADVVALTDLLDLTASVEVDEQTLGWLHRRAGTQPRVRLDGFPALLADPGPYLLDRLAPSRWRSSDEVVATMLLIGTVLGPLLRPRAWRPQLRSRRWTSDPLDAVRFPVAELVLPAANGTTTSARVDVEGVGADGSMPSGASGPGLALTPQGSFSTDIEVAGWQLTANGDVDSGGTAIEITGAGVDLAPAVAVALDVALYRDLDLVVGVGRTGLTLGKLELTAGLSAGGGADAELRLGLAALDSSLGISTADFGDAIAKVLPFDLTLPFDLGVDWSSLRGVTLRGAASLEIRLADELSLAGGAFVVRNLTLGLVIEAGAAPSVGLAVTGDVEFSIDVLAATVGGMGLLVELTFPPGGGNLGQAHLALGVDPPESLGLFVDLEGVSGGGYLDIDHELGRYSGALSIDVIGVGITAVTVIDTKLPDDPDGFALFASLTISFAGIPLGFGFVLTGVGGIIAIDRALDAEALATGLRNGVIDSLLFPDDPIGDSARLIAQIDDYFPLQPGNSVFGPVIEVGWGAPTPLITAQVGVVISIPDGVIAVLGSISALLPLPAAPLITLHLDVLGTIDIPGGELSIVASLYDSRLLETIDLSGDMAMYVRADAQPYFLLSVGGYHPSFSPPANLPAAMQDLRRMTASIHIASNVKVVIQSYFALTSNTVQFGASINVEASVEIWPTTYTARGWFEFNVLLQFSPFKLVADMSAGVAVYSGNKEVMGVQLSVTLEGPKPWFVVGTATFKFFGVNVNFELEVGSTAAGEPKSTVELRTLVIEALESGASWRESGPVSGLSAGIVFGAFDPGAADDDTVWVRPDRQLAVSQGVAPFDRDLEIVGQGVPAAGHERLTITDAGFGALGSMPWTTVDDWFAPAQYESLGRTESLTRASYELMTAGVTFGSAEIVGPDGDQTREVTTDFEDEVWQPGADGADGMLRTSGMRSALARTAHAAAPMFTLSSTTWTVVSAVDGTAAFPDGVPGIVSGPTLARGVSQHTALAATRASVSEDPRLASAVVVMPATALLDTAPTPP